MILNKIIFAIMISSLSSFVYATSEDNGNSTAPSDESLDRLVDSLCDETPSSTPVLTNSGHGSTPASSGTSTPPVSEESTVPQVTDVELLFLLVQNHQQIYRTYRNFPPASREQTLVSDSISYMLTVIPIFEARAFANDDINLMEAVASAWARIGRRTYATNTRNRIDAFLNVQRPPLRPPVLMQAAAY
jgi:hypothetical protein